MRASVDVGTALELLPQLEPELAAHEASGGSEAPELSDGESLDRALRAGLARLRVQVGRATFIYLRWKAEHARAKAQAARAPAVSSRARARA
jgi:hypothetical protein